MSSQILIWLLVTFLIRSRSWYSRVKDSGFFSPTRPSRPTSVLERNRVCHIVHRKAVSLRVSGKLQANANGPQALSRRMPGLKQELANHLPVILLRNRGGFHGFWSRCFIVAYRHSTADHFASRDLHAPLVSSLRKALDFDRGAFFEFMRFNLRRRSPNSESSLLHSR
jgi:hypothetical protein